MAPEPPAGAPEGVQVEVQRHQGGGPSGQHLGDAARPGARLEGGAAGPRVGGPPPEVPVAAAGEAPVPEGQEGPVVGLELVPERVGRGGVAHRPVPPPRGAGRARTHLWPSGVYSM